MLEPVVLSQAFLDSFIYSNQILEKVKKLINVIAEFMKHISSLFVSHLNIIKNKFKVCYKYNEYSFMC